MARTTGPLASMGASGTVGGVVTHSTWKGRSYVKKNTIPTNPKTDIQTSVRAGHSFLTMAWAGITTPERATWETLALKTNVTPLAAFLAHNLARFGNYLGPVTVYPDPVEDPPFLTPTWSATGGVRNVFLEFTWPFSPKNWFMELHRSTVSPVALDRSTIFHHELKRGGGPVTHRDTPLQPGTYYYRVYAVSITGVKIINALTKSAVVT